MFRVVVVAVGKVAGHRRLDYVTRVVVGAAAAAARVVAVRSWGISGDSVLFANVLPEDGVVGDLVPVVRDLGEFVKVFGPNVGEKEEDEFARQLGYVVALELGLDVVVNVFDVAVVA